MRGCGLVVCGLISYCCLQQTQTPEAHRRSITPAAPDCRCKQHTRATAMLSRDRRHLSYQSAQRGAATHTASPAPGPPPTCVTPVEGL